MPVTRSLQEYVIIPEARIRQGDVVGTWGTSLYANDTSSDVRNLVRELVRLPWSSEQILTSVLQSYPVARDEDAEDYPDVWLALADQLYDYGLLDEAVQTRVMRIVRSRQDLDLKRQLGLSEREARVRGAMLEKLAEKLERPNPKPKPRRTLKAPEPIVFPPGTVLRYPTQQGLPINPWFSTAVLARDFKADGWGTAIVLTAGHFEGYMAWYGMGRLGAHGRPSPSLKDCLASGIENEPNWANETGAGTLAVALGCLQPSMAQKMKLEAIGTLEIDHRRVKTHVSPLATASRRPYATLDTLFLNWRSKEVVPFGDDDLPLPRVVIALSDLARRS
ncbi:MAG: hypothetical protein ACKVP7_06325 [Hyphomicrobiaceae bacterium]